MQYNKKIIQINNKTHMSNESMTQLQRAIEAFDDILN